MENKVIAKEYVDKNYIHNELIKRAITDFKIHMIEDDNVDENGWIQLEWAIKYLEELLEDK